MKTDLIIFDMDDTLLTSQNKVSQLTKDYLLKVQQQGYKLTLASGRPTEGMLEVAKELKLDEYGSYIMSYNGGQTMDISNQSVIAKKSVSKENFDRIVDFCRENDMMVLTYYNGEIVIEGEHEYMGVESKLTGMPMIQVSDIKAHVQTDVPKAMAVDYEDKIAEMLATQTSQFTDELTVTISKPFFLEFMSKGVSKGAAIRRLAEQLDLSIDRMIAFGDSANDLDMIETVGTGVAMGNALEIVKEKADVVTKSHDEDGIPYILEQLIGISIEK
ncbi:Cof-type HAD-IIB family hydrolase [Staphylococcus sp. IVB6246]|uniref:Cof-type HAD-IIB family hydrolase n=1 Tax=unclassified Staphylococcus TaxID=91994 RepID=UPI0021D2CFC3|nr:MULTISPECIES: Cof-type HAD-IIB family hydrolase [unclassified Staphylococcus]UXR68834.1 Cof-type HAD-IIB family hydrolase [Staphylococcus sp. IVB6246]UXR70891.1 Cof-type HAD-IIB family hydrolase [Staphylococcus sp. IVB6240]UXR73121.1 Cof-type HAD-IIB family hydrolase [Staphylococcus sp. IVB6238]